jgi:hypothetical protein
VCASPVKIEGLRLRQCSGMTPERSEAGRADGFRVTGSLRVLWAGRLLRLDHRRRFDWLRLEKRSGRGHSVLKGEACDASRYRLSLFRPCSLPVR